LVWLLVRRLSLGLPTALQIRSSEAVLFHEGGVSLFQDLINNLAYLGLGPGLKNPSSKIWVLVDSNFTLQEPTPVFCMGYPFFVVEAVSREQRLEWCKKARSTYFYMKTWDFSEVLQAYVTLLSGVHNIHYFCSRPFLGLLRGPHDESELSYLYNEYRASPRELAIYASKPEELKVRIFEQVMRMGPDNLRHTLQNPECDDSAHLITRVEPSSLRSLATKTIASPGAFKLLRERHLKNRVTDTGFYYDIFQQGGPVTASAAGWIFEFRMHQLLAQGYFINLFPLGNPGRGKEFDVYSDYSDSHKNKNEMTFQLAASSEYLLSEGIELEVGCYYRPEAKNFATIDSLLLIHPCNDPFPILLMFQITRNQGGHV